MNKQLYARVVDGRIDIFEGNYVSLEGRTYYSPNERILRRLGYKPLITTPSPKLNEGDFLSVSYIDRGESIETVYSVTGGIV